MIHSKTFVRNNRTLLGFFESHTFRNVEMTSQLALKNILKLAVAYAVIGCFGCSFVAPSFAQVDDGLSRLLKQASVVKETKIKTARTAPAPAPSILSSQTNQNLSPACSATACLIPNAIEAADRVRKASHNSQEPLNFSDPTGFNSRDEEFISDMVYPTPLAYGKRVYGVEESNGKDLKISTPGYNGWNPDAGRDEYVFDGNDRGSRVKVDPSWNVYGLDTEDTVGHFDTLDGRRIVTPSNRVAIYAPRFGAVRKVDGVFNATMKQPVIALEEQTPIAQAAGKDGSTTSKQHVALNRMDGSNRASGFIDRTRGVTSDTVTHLFGMQNNLQSFENLSLMVMGKVNNAESARLNLGLQSAAVWEDNLGLQVVAKNASPIIVRDAKTVQELVHVEAEDGTAILRVTKIASKIAARTGDIVDFTIRFDNLSGKKIGNVTLIDNLTRRLEYVPDSAQSTLKADFINKRNDGGSLMLRWEIIDPVDAHSGGVIRFKCRVR